MSSQEKNGLLFWIALEVYFKTASLLVTVSWPKPVVPMLKPEYAWLYIHGEFVSFGPNLTSCKPAPTLICCVAIW
jgi:hypothetical protein